MTDFTTVAIFPTYGKNNHFPVSKQIVKVQLSLNLLGTITCFTFPSILFFCFPYKYYYLYFPYKSSEILNKIL